MKTNNISENNHSELYELFAVLISPFIEINYPELLQEIKIDKNKINKQIEEQIEILELKVQADETAYTELYTLLGFYIFELAKNKNFEKAYLFLNKIKKNTEKDSYFRDYLYTYGPAILAISMEEKKNNLHKEIYDFLRTKYGESIIFNPTPSIKNIMLWLAPALFFLIGVYIIFRRLGASR